MGKTIGGSIVIRHKDTKEEKAFDVTGIDDGTGFFRDIKKAMRSHGIKTDKATMSKWIIHKMDLD